MSIQTDSTPLEDPKNPETDNVFALYKLVASPEQTEEMRQNYLKGGYGYGHAKSALLEVLLENYAEAREKFNYYLENKNEVDKFLLEGAAKAEIVANDVLRRVREKLGLLV